MKIEITEYPTDNDWLEVKKRALVTIGKKLKTPPDAEWKRAILKARHSPIRRLRFSFYLEGIPSYVSVHLARHIHAQPFIKSQRNDRQDNYDRNKAPQDTPVNMIWDITGEEMMIIANKRLCNMADATTQDIVGKMCAEIVKHDKDNIWPEFLVPMCKYTGECKEIYPCKKAIKKVVVTEPND